MNHGAPHLDASDLLERMRRWGRALGFSQIGVASIDLADAEPGLQAWLDAGFHGSMGYMERHGLTRARPAQLVPGTVSIITARMDYLPRDLIKRAPSSVQAQDADTDTDAHADKEAEQTWVDAEWQSLASPTAAVVSVYARGRDYHKVLRQRLQSLVERLAEAVGPFGHRVFCDSAPLLEVELASRSGLGWRGKHTLALHRDAGSMFFLGEICTDLSLPTTQPVSGHCGQCTACIDLCPTQAIVAPYRLDARRCISYLTIEHDGAIPIELRPLIGNRIYGCDDCQLACPWNKFAKRSPLADFDPRAGLDRATLLDLWAWDEATFLRETEGSAIRRIGFARWQRNVAVALGNALGKGAHSELDRSRDVSPFGAEELDADAAAKIRQALSGKLGEATAMVAEHIQWALAQGHNPKS